MPKRHPTIGIITALPEEFAAMKALLEDHEPYNEPGSGAGRRYLLGQIPASSGAPHEVALCMCEMGNNSASARATLLLEHFKKIETIIMTGIAGGVPNHEVPAIHVRLGDIVVSDWQGVVQYDMKNLQEVTCNPRPPAAKLQEAVRFLEVAAIEGNYPWEEFIKPVLKACKWKKPAQKADVLYSPDNPDQEIPHPKDKDRRGVKPRVFSGTIASSNELLRDPKKRDELAKKHGVRAVEMETSGVADATWNHGVGYFGIRGICDYCDPKKGYKWQEYAATVAAAYTRALLESMPGEPEGNQNCVIFKVEFRLDQEIFNFDQNEFVAAVEQRLGIDMQNVKVSVRTGSVIVTLEGNSEVLSALVGQIENSRLFEDFAEQTGLESVTWVVDGIEETWFSPFAQSRPSADPSRKATPERDGSEVPAKPVEPPRVSIGHLPPPGKHFIGRDAELALLDEAWEDPNTHVVEFVAFGGVGKSALVAEWLKAMQNDGWRGAACVLGHSFYSQGSREDAQASADSFINEALQFFGDPDPTAGSPWDKGERLARLVRKQPTLLILDGAEPLQYPGTSGSAGQIRDPGLQALVRELAAGMNGLVVISTRIRVQDIEGWEDSSVKKVNLENLSATAGASLLAILGVSGTDEERAAASKQVKGHGLALNLLGTYLQKAFGGDIQRLDEVKLSQVVQRAGSHARHMMERYERFLGDSPELSIVRLLGLFDRPATMGEINAVCAEPAISGLTDAIVGLSEVDWNYARDNLCEYGLLDRTSDRDTLDAHPLIREHFAAQLDEHHAEAAREAHRRLYEYLKESAPELPDNLGDMMPLYHAVAHGCKAGLWQDALADVYRRRICRHAEEFNLKKLGSFGADLAAISCFFTETWTKPVHVFSDPIKGSLFGSVGFALRALGRLSEACEPIVAAIELRIENESWKGAAIQSSNLSELSLTLGDVSSAVRRGEQSVELADRSGDAFQRIGKRTTLADALHASGRVKSEGGRVKEGEASAFSLSPTSMAFREAEAMQKEMQPEYPLLYSVQGYQYCDLLIDELSALSDLQFASALGDGEETYMCQLQQVRNCAATTLKIAETALTGILNRALDHLTLGRTWLAEAELRISQNSNPESQVDKAEHHLDESVALLRQAGTQHHLPRGLLHRAALWRVRFQINNDKSQVELAERDLSEAETIAGRGSMLIWQIEAALERTRLALCRAKSQIPNGKSQMEIACNKLAEAKRLVEQTEKPYEPHVPDWPGWQPPEYVGVFKKGEIVGYHCRNDEIERLQKQIDSLK